MLLHARTRFLCLLILIFGALAVNAQSDNQRDEDALGKTSYEVRIQLLITSEKLAKELPNSLAAVENCKLSLAKLITKLP